MNTLYWTLWPAFLVAALATGLLIVVIDPQDLQFGGQSIEMTDIGAYTLGFLVLWLFSAASSLTTLVLLRDAGDINQSLSR